MRGIGWVYKNRNEKGETGNDTPLDWARETDALE
jgi:hypothetical protein